MKDTFNNGEMNVGWIVEGFGNQVNAMPWVYLFALGLALWGGCGAVMTIARRIWSLDTALRVHLAAAPIIAFVASAVHKLLAGDFSPVLRPP